MARKRMLDPGIWDSEQVQSLTAEQFKLYIFLISQADDEGRLKLSVPLFKSRVHPIDGYMSECFITDLAVICHCGLTHLYSDDAENLFLSHPNWNVYQKLNRKFPSHLPDPNSCRDIEISDYHSLVSDISRTTHSPITNPSLPMEGKGIEEKRRTSPQKKVPLKKEIAPLVHMTSEEIVKLNSEFGEADAKSRIEKLSLYKGSTGKEYASDYLTILSWDRKNKPAGNGSRPEPEDARRRADRLETERLDKLARRTAEENRENEMTKKGALDEF